jgi:photosystem II stability/assembly factor-like uncharacterized protein
LRRLLTSWCLCALLAMGCGSSGLTATQASHGIGRPAHSTSLVDAAIPPYVKALAVDPARGSVLIATNRGLFRIPRGGGAPTPIHAHVSAGRRSGPYGRKVSSFAYTDSDRLVGSGHADGPGHLPAFLGFMVSRDGGETWRSVSRTGFSDLHVMAPVGSRIYAFDTVLGATIESRDGGRTFSERQSPSGPALALAADPAAPDYLLAATTVALARSTDGGRTWHPLGSADEAQLAWSRRGLVRTVADGTVSTSTDRGATWSQVGKLPGSAAKLVATDDGRLYAAMLDGAVEISVDGGRSWTEIAER